MLQAERDVNTAEPVCIVVLFGSGTEVYSEKLSRRLSETDAQGVAAELRRLADEVLLKG